MRHRTRIYYTEEQKSQMWDRWQRGDSLHSIARRLIGTTRRFARFSRLLAASVHCGVDVRCAR